MISSMPMSFRVVQNGGYISFIVSKDEPHNRSYTIFNKGRNETTYIEWHSTTKAGRVKNAVHFGDSNWHWDASQKDATCP